MAQLKEKNLFGGGNPTGVYVPLSELEQEALARLVAAGDLVLKTSQGTPTISRITHGDLRLGIQFKLSFFAPAAPVSLMFLDLELRTQAGRLLYQERQPTLDNGRPIKIADGLDFEMVWDIALHHLDPKLVKDLLPGAVGLTNRRTDKDTGEVTLFGNMRDLDGHKRKTLQALATAESKLKGEDRQTLAKLAGKARKGG